MKIPFFRSLIDEKEHELINEALDKNATYLVDSLENKIKEYFGSAHAITTNNGTAAKHLALCAMDIKRGDKVICSVNSFPSTAQVIRQFDAEPIFVDIDEDDFNISVKEFEKTLEKHKSKKLKAAFIASIAGQAPEMDKIYDIADKYGIKIIDDAIRALGATYKGKRLGTMNSFISCFQVNPQIRQAAASTGIIITNDDKIADRARLIRTHAIVNDSFDKDGNLGYIYDVIELGQKYDLNYLCAAFSLGQFSKTESFIKRRKQIASIYNEELKNCPGITIPAVKQDHIYTQYIIKIDKNRDEFAKKMLGSGIKVGLHYIPLHTLSYYRQKYKYKINDFPSALRVYQQVLSLPIYASLRDDEVDYICKTIKQIAKDRV